MHFKLIAPVSRSQPTPRNADRKVPNPRTLSECFVVGDPEHRLVDVAFPVLTNCLIHEFPCPLSAVSAACKQTFFAWEFPVRSDDCLQVTLVTVVNLSSANQAVQIRRREGIEINRSHDSTTGIDQYRRRPQVDSVALCHVNFGDELLGE